jgi:hypothetical protein
MTGHALQPRLDRTQVIDEPEPVAAVLASQLAKRASWVTENRISALYFGFRIPGKPFRITRHPINGE